MADMGRFSLVCFIVVALVGAAGVQAINFNVVNSCGFGGNVEFTGHPGIVLSPGQSQQVAVDAGWSGRISLDPTPSTLAEFTVGVNNKNTMDISLVDGFNVGMRISYSGGGCIKNGAAVSGNVECKINIDQCPSAYRQGQRCVSPNKDAQTDYSNTVKGICPDAYSWSKDDATSTFTCDVGGDYTVTFCP